ncbi:MULTISPECIES: 2-polyprenyl-6-methoxyphenol hydroxylase-like oxidoreductase [unclassified Mycobacterium]|uniref:FAD-dependent oxidoreductase n=1 Tax=unclassified Mycobacterium TaxID=2642494 RepID=UPI0029C5FE0D|nr:MULTISPECIES: 2-polyprenyl-6-methoxyphenol hydroxylase-like oxidoreductase [unclassified Mycobacterium]
MHQRRKSAVVCGASMAGLFAARVLSDFYESVTVVERDVLPETVAQRRGVAQGRHLHMMLSPGSTYADELFPGLLDELAAAGAHLPDPTDPSPLYLRFGAHELCRTGRFTSPDQIVILLASRPLLEHHVRRRVSQLENVTFQDGHDVVEPIVGPPDRVSAVRIVDRATGETQVLETDLLVDATGRSARTPAFLEGHGYDRPVDQKYAVNLSYSSQFFRIPVGALTDKVAVVAPTLERPSGAGMLAYEDDTAILTLIGIAGHELPTDLTGVLAFAADLLPAHYMAALRAAEPLGDVSAARYPASVWRRYDKLTRFPKGLLVIGDAVCSFNPVWGQGMTSAGLQAAALHRCLSESDTDDVSRRYFRTAAKKLAPIWRTNRLIDFSITPADDWRSIPKRLMNWWINKTFAAAAHDVELTETYFRTIVLVDPLTALLRPGRLRRVLTA